jgi:hypothetical protein
MFNPERLGSIKGLTDGTLPEAGRDILLPSP